MGSPISLLVADMFMTWFEAHYFLIEANPFKIQIQFRYHVNDIFLSFGGCQKEVSNLLEFASDCHESIWFTFEIENEGF